MQKEKVGVQPTRRPYKRPKNIQGVPKLNQEKQRKGLKEKLEEKRGVGTKRGKKPQHDLLLTSENVAKRGGGKKKTGGKRENERKGGTQKGGKRCPNRQNFGSSTLSLIEDQRGKKKKAHGKKTPGEGGKKKARRPEGPGRPARALSREKGTPLSS